jgi:hypothetical protein
MNDAKRLPNAAVFATEDFFERDHSRDLLLILSTSNSYSLPQELASCSSLRAAASRD